MTVRLGLLAILDQGPCYGYQLRSELDRRTGATGPINVGQIYNTLDRLERDRLVRKTGEKNYYEITEAGRDAVAQWFGSPSPADDLPGKLALAATLPGVDAASILQIQRTSAAARVAGLSMTAEASNAGRDAAPSVDSLTRDIIRAAAVASARAELEFLDEAEELLARGVERLPLQTDVPRRGRPPRARNPEVDSAVGSEPDSAAAGTD